MEYLKLSIKSLEEENKKLFEIINKNFDYDCVVFIAKGSYLIGKDLATFKNVPLLEIFSKRKGATLKKIVNPILKILPTKMKKVLREKEFNSDVHTKNYERKIFFEENIWKKYKNVQNILIVDDSVDTGYSMKFVKDEVHNFFDKENRKNIKVAALNCFEKSEKIVKTDYFVYKNTILEGPWSNDSKENDNFIKLYKDWHIKQL